jgi:hypothetical protein
MGDGPEEFTAKTDNDVESIGQTCHIINIEGELEESTQ